MSDLAIHLDSLTRHFGAVKAVDGLSLEKAASRGIATVRKLSREVGIRQSLRELGGKREALPQMAQKAAGVERLTRIQPRRMTEEAALAILERAY